MIEVKVYNIKVEDINKSDFNTKDTYPMVEYQFYGFLMDEIQLVNEQNARLKVEVHRLEEIVGSDAINKKYGMCCDASAQVERLNKDYDTIFKDRALLWASHKIALQDIQRLHYALQAAKEGKQS